MSNNARGDAYPRVIPGEPSPLSRSKAVACTVCGASFWTRSALTLTCSNACKRVRAHLPQPRPRWNLLPREIEVLTLRYGQTPRMFLAVVGDRMGLSKGRVGQMEQKALGRLRMVRAALARGEMVSEETQRMLMFMERVQSDA